MRSSLSISELAGDIQGLKNWEKGSAESNTEQVARMKKKMKEAIETELTPRQREVLLIVLSKGCSQVEIAKELGVNRSTISRTLSRAVVKLRKVLRYAT